MDQQHMTTETNVIDNVFDYPMLEQSIFGGIDAIEDQSADIYAAVIDNTAILPDDDAVSGNLSPIPKKRYSTMRKVTAGTRTKNRLAKRMQALLQEEHALWLK